MNSLKDIVNHFNQHGVNILFTQNTIIEIKYSNHANDKFSLWASQIQRVVNANPNLVNFLIEITNGSVAYAWNNDIDPPLMIPAGQ